MGDNDQSLLESLENIGGDAAPLASSTSIGSPLPEEADIEAPGASPSADPLPEGEPNLAATPAAEAPAEPVLAEPVPEEPTDGLSVEDMLAAAVLAEGVPAVATDAGPVTAPDTCFQVRVLLDKTASRDPLKKLAQEMSLTVADAAWLAEVPLLSQLTEYQAVRFLQSARQLGFQAVIDMGRPAHGNSEEDLALGDLSGVPDPDPVKAEGAPLVTLPGNEKGVMLLTSEVLPGFVIQQTLGVVTAHRSIARRLFRETELEEKLRKELGRLPGRTASNLPTSRLEQLLREIFLDLQKAALSHGGNAVLSLDLEAFPETSHVDSSLEEIRLVAFGTAAVVEKI